MLKNINALLELFFVPIIVSLSGVMISLRADTVEKNPPCILKVNTNCENHTTFCYYSYTDTFEQKKHKEVCYKLFEICMDKHTLGCSKINKFQNCLLAEKKNCNLLACQHRKSKEECYENEALCFEDAIKTCSTKNNGEYL